MLVKLPVPLQKLSESAFPKAGSDGFTRYVYEVKHPKKRRRAPKTPTGFWISVFKYDRGRETL